MTKSHTRVGRAALDVPDPETVVDRVVREATTEAATKVVDLILREGARDFRAAAKEAGVPRLSYHAIRRAWIAGRLEAVRVAGRVLTSAAAIRRWLAASQGAPQPAPRTAPRGRRGKRRPTTSAAERAILAARGLPCGGGRDE